MDALFLQSQIYDTRETLFYQDNQSTIILANNGFGSSSKITFHMNIWYFFITERVKSKEAAIEYFPTDEMIADSSTNTLQGSKFIKFGQFILNIQDLFLGFLQH